MTDVQYWILYGLLFAIVVMLFNIYRILARIHHDNLIHKMDRDRSRLRDDVRDVAQIITQLGPEALPDDIVERIFGGVTEMVRKEDEVNNGSERS